MATFGDDFLELQAVARGVVLQAIGFERGDVALQLGEAGVALLLELRVVAMLPAGEQVGDVVPRGHDQQRATPAGVECLGHAADSRAETVDVASSLNVVAPVVRRWLGRSLVDRTLRHTLIGPCVRLLQSWSA